MGLISRVSSRTYRMSQQNHDTRPIVIQSTAPLTEPSRFIKLKRVRFTDGGAPRIWDYTQSHDSVAIIIYNRDTKQLVFVKQFRPALLMERLDRGITIPENEYRA